jgi:hypothetical protein
MDKFQVYKLDNGQYDFLVIASPYENPLNTFDEIVDKIRVEKAILLIDLALINGMKKNRYVVCNYEKGKCPQLSSFLVDDVDDHIKSLSKNYFAQNEDAIQKSIIPNALKFLLTQTELVK